MRSLSVLLTACSALALAGCGSGTTAPKIDRAAARQLSADSTAVADLASAGDTCGAAHRADELNGHVASAIRSGAVPASLAPQLRSNAQALVDELTCSPLPPPPPQEGDHHGKGDDKRKHGEGGD